MKAVTIFLLIATLVLTGCPAPVGPQNGGSSDSSVDAKKHPFFTDADFLSPGGEHILILKKDKTLWAVGSNGKGQLGDGTTTAQTVPVKVMDNILSVEAGAFYTMIVKDDDSLWGVGANEMGQLGNNTTTDQPKPVKIMESVRQVSASDTHTMVVKKNDTLWGFGQNHFGQIGNGVTTVVPPTKIRPRPRPPKLKAGSTDLVKTAVQVLTDPADPETALDNVEFVSTGAGAHTMVLTKTNSLWGFGRDNARQLGNGEPENLGEPSPVNILNDSGQPTDDVKQVAAAFTYTMVVKTNDSLHFTGILGVDPDDAKTGLKKVTDDWEELISDGVKKIAAANGHAMIIKTDDSLWAIGRNGKGQLGDGTTTDRTEPKKIIQGVKDVYAGFKYTYFIKKDGSLWAMGLNDKGQLGDGTTTDRLTPVQVKMNEK